MKELLPLYLSGLIIMIWSEKNSHYDYKNERYQYHEKVLYIIFWCCAVVFAGMRTSYNDTAQYISTYNNIVVNNGIFSNIEWSLGEYPAFVLLENILKIRGCSAQTFILVTSVISVGIPLWFIYKYSNNTLMSVFLFFTMGYFNFTMAAIKQCCAIAFGLIAVDRLIRKKIVPFIVWILVAAMFHPFILLFFVAPLLSFVPWTVPTFLMLVSFGIAGLTTQRWLDNLLELMTFVGTEYDVSLLQGDGVNIFRFAVVWAPIILSMLIGRHRWETVREQKAQLLMMNFSMLCAEFMFIALFANPVYFGRLANYFLIFQVISLPWMMQFFESKSRKLMVSLIVIGFSCYNIYGNLFSGHTFDQIYSSVSIFRYLFGV